MTVITKNMKIYDIVKEYPHLMDVLIVQSPKFEKLKNKILFNTMAKVATVEDAAKIGKIPIEQLVQTLNQAMDGSRVDEEQKVQIIEGNKEIEKKEQIDTQIHTLDFPVIDVRNEEDPFQRILGIVKITNPGEGFYLIQSFEPAPLYKVLERKGFTYKTDKVSDDEFRVLFLNQNDKA